MNYIPYFGNKYVRNIFYKLLAGSRPRCIVSASKAMINVLYVDEHMHKFDRFAAGDVRAGELSKR